MKNDKLKKYYITAVLRHFSFQVYFKVYFVLLNFYVQSKILGLYILNFLKVQTGSNSQNIIVLTHKTFELITEIVGWILIVLSPTLIGIAFGLAFYFNLPNDFGLIISNLIAITGLTIGIIWATKKFRTTGTIHFLSRISATPELDNVEKTESGKKKNSH